MKANFFILLAIFIAIWVLAYKLPWTSPWGKVKPICFRLAEVLLFVTVAYGVFTFGVWYKFH